MPACPSLGTEFTAHSADPEISVVIPVYGSEAGLPELHRRLLLALNDLGRSFEILYVEDRSPDGAWSTLVRLRRDDHRVTLIRLLKNVGQQRAVLCGLANAKGQYVVTMDDDLQHRPEEIGLLVRALESGEADAVIGRYEAKKHGVIRRLGTWLVKRVAKHTVGVPLSLDLTSFRALKREIAKQMGEMYNPSPVVGYLLFEVTTSIDNVTVHHDPRASGTSTYGFRHLVTYLLQMVLDYSDLPLRSVGYLGFLVSLASFLLSSYYAIRYLTGSITVAGWATLVLLLTFFSGLILMTLGIIGLYLVRILRSINAPTRYAIRERIEA